MRERLCVTHGRPNGANGRLTVNDARCLPIPGDRPRWIAGKPSVTKGKPNAIALRGRRISRLIRQTERIV